MRSALLVALLLVVGAARVFAKCGDGPTDNGTVVAARQDAASTCPCASFANHGQYVKCVRGVANARSHLDPPDPNFLPRDCKSAVVRCAAQSACGKPGFVTCCIPQKSAIPKCKTKRDATRCTDAGGTVGGDATTGCSSCCDACPTGGPPPGSGPSCVAPTTSTSTTSTSTTTSTTLGVCTCSFFAVTPGANCPPSCRGSCASGEDCAEFCSTGSSDCFPQSAVCSATCLAPTSTTTTLPSCPNGVCEPALGEDCTTCPQDCGTCPTSSSTTTSTLVLPGCGDSVCDGGTGENCETCPQDCGCGEGTYCYRSACFPDNPPFCNSVTNTTCTSTTTTSTSSTTLP